MAQQNNNHRTSNILITTALLVGTGCASNVSNADLSAAEAESGGDVLVDTTATTSALLSSGLTQTSTQSNAELFTYSANDLDITLRPTDSHVCFLTRVSGNLGGASVLVVHRSTAGVQAYYRSQGLLGGYPQNESSTTWYLGGAQREKNSLTGEATCVPIADFHGDPGYQAMYSDSGWAYEKQMFPGCEGHNSAELWRGDAASFLTGIQGDFAGSGEVAEIVDGPVDGTSQVRIKSGKCGDYAEADGRSFFVGIPGQTSMWRYNYSAGAGSDQSRTTPMLATKEGVCYLHRVSGSFDGAEERVRIYPAVDGTGVERWMLEATAGGGSASAVAQCITYNQDAGCAGPDVPCI